MYHIIVKKSVISGRGIFANRNFKKGEIVLSWHPKLLTQDQLAVLSNEEKHYIVNQNGQTYLMQIPERFVNHSCNPNTCTQNLSDVAIRDILKGEEITSDYSCSDQAPDFICNCGSLECRYR